MLPSASCAQIPSTTSVFTHRWTEIHYSIKSETPRNSKRYVRLAWHARRSSLGSLECRFSNNQVCPASASASDFALQTKVWEATRCGSGRVVGKPLPNRVKSELPVIRAEPPETPI